MSDMPTKTRMISVRMALKKQNEVSSLTQKPVANAGSHGSRANKRYLRYAGEEFSHHCEIVYQLVRSTTAVQAVSKASFGQVCYNRDGKGDNDLQSGDNPYRHRENLAEPIISNATPIGVMVVVDVLLISTKGY
jgi:hypothetical protein